MGFLDKAKQAATKAVDQHGGKISKAIDQGAEMADKKTGGKHRDKIRKAPVTVIIGMDGDFHEHLPTLFPHVDARAWFLGDGKATFRRDSAFRNSTLQGAYLMIAARALGVLAGVTGSFAADGLASRIRLEQDPPLGTAEAFAAFDAGEVEQGVDALIAALATADGHADDVRRVIVGALAELGVEHPFARDARRRLAAALY